MAPMSEQIKDCATCYYMLRQPHETPCLGCASGDGALRNWTHVSDVHTEFKGGVKHDQDKLRMDLLPSEALFAAARVFTEGAKKYGERNWEKGLDAWRLYNAVLRHLLKWNMGEELNSEDFNLPHLDHALTCLMMLVALQMRAQGKKGYENG